MAEYGESLTEREVEILEGVATGATNREVAYRLGISTNTVKVHLRHIFTKLGAESRTEATMIAVRKGWVEVPAAQPSSPAPVRVQPLPLSRKVALVAAAVVVMAGTVASWPRPAESRRASAGLLPPQAGQEGDVRVAVGEESNWSERAQMPTRRAGLALAVWERELYAISGEGPEGVSGVVEVYNADSDTWERAAEKPTPTAYVAAGVVEGRIYVPGGRTSTGEATAAVEVYEPATDLWSEASSLPLPLYAYAVAVYEGQIYVFGGTDDQEVLRTTYVYDPAGDAWEERASMPEARTVAAATTLGERIYVVGGFRDGRQLNTCAVYDPAENRWDECAPLTVGRGGLGLVGLGGQLYAIGGGAYLGFNERYDPRSDRWTAVETPLTGVWQAPGVALLDMAVYAVGGWTRGYESLNLAFEPLPYRIFIPATER
ncbi:MAG: kelch repeat-containing protein [Anaerolineae bacterium]